MLTQAPIKQRIASIKNSIEESRAANAQSKKQLILVQKQMGILQTRLADPFTVVKRFFDVARDNLMEQFQKQSELHEEQAQFLQEQIHQMIDDKLKANQNCLMLQQKMRHLSQDIGL